MSTGASIVNIAMEDEDIYQGIYEEIPDNNPYTKLSVPKGRPHKKTIDRREVDRHHKKPQASKPQKGHSHKKHITSQERPTQEREDYLTMPPPTRPPLNITQEVRSSQTRRNALVVVGLVVALLVIGGMAVGLNMESFKLEGVDIRACNSSSCQIGESCNEGVNGYTCSCSPGYTGDACEIDILECASYPCQNGVSCVEEVNSYWCMCKPGYTGINCETDWNQCIQIIIVAAINLGINLVICGGFAVKLSIDKILSRREYQAILVMTVAIIIFDILCLILAGIPVSIEFAGGVVLLVFAALLYVWTVANFILLVYCLKAKKGVTQ